jgi:hypothetical protein
VAMEVGRRSRRSVGAEQARLVRCGAARRWHRPFYRRRRSVLRKKSLRRLWRRSSRVGHGGRRRDDSGEVTPRRSAWSIRGLTRQVTGPLAQRRVASVNPCTAHASCGVAGVWRVRAGKQLARTRGQARLLWRRPGGVREWQGAGAVGARRASQERSGAGEATAPGTAG